MTLVEQPPTRTFTTRELARLVAYRAAVVAGFYTDWDGSASSTDTRVLPRLLRARRGAGYPFTPRERQHLVRLRKAVAAGGFASDRPQPVEPTPATDEGPRPLADQE
jgi:hypothetical protein